MRGKIKDRVTTKQYQPFASQSNLIELDKVNIKLPFNETFLKIKPN
jgi:hypothetical protein